MKLLLLTLLCCAGLVAHAPGAEPAPAGQTGPGNFVFLVDTSKAMASRSRALQQTVFDLINTGFYGKMRGGDRIWVVPFNEKLFLNKLPLQNWAPEVRQLIAMNAAQLLSRQPFEKKASLETVVPELLRNIRPLDSCVVVVLSDGGTVIFGTPFDRPLNLFYGKHFDQFQHAGWLFVTSFLARNGELEAWSVNANGDRISLPDLEDIAAPAKKTSAKPAKDPATQAATKPAAEPAKPAEKIGTVASMTVQSAPPPVTETPKNAPAPPPAAGEPLKPAVPTTPPPPAALPATITAPQTVKPVVKPAVTAATPTAPAASVPSEPSPAATKTTPILTSKSSSITQPAATAPTAIVQTPNFDSLAKLESSHRQIETAAPEQPGPVPKTPPPASKVIVEKSAVITPAPASLATTAIRTLPAEAPAKTTERAAPAKQLPVPMAMATTPPPENRSGMLLALGLGLLVMAGGLSWWLLFRSHSTPQPSLISRSMRKDKEQSR